MIDEQLVFDVFVRLKRSAPDDYFRIVLVSLMAAYHTFKLRDGDDMSAFLDDFFRQVKGSCECVASLFNSNSSL